MVRGFARFCAGSGGFFACGCKLGVSFCFTAILSTYSCARCQKNIVTIRWSSQPPTLTTSRRLAPMRKGGEANAWAANLVRPVGEIARRAAACPSRVCRPTAYDPQPTSRVSVHCDAAYTSALLVISDTLSHRRQIGASREDAREFIRCSGVPRIPMIAADDLEVPGASQRSRLIQVAPDMRTGSCDQQSRV